MPLKFWDEAFLTATYLINRTPCRVIDFSTPLTRLFGGHPNYSFLRVFGCACWPNLRPYNTHKLQFCSKRCAFLGYSNLHKGYKCLDISTGRVYISRDVVFDEDIFPFAQLHSNAGSCLQQDILLLPSHLINHDGDMNRSFTNVSNTLPESYVSSFDDPGSNAQPNMSRLVTFPSLADSGQASSSSGLLDASSAVSDVDLGAKSGVDQVDQTPTQVDLVSLNPAVPPAPEDPASSPPLQSSPTELLVPGPSVVTSVLPPEPQRLDVVASESPWRLPPPPPGSPRPIHGPIRILPGRPHTHLQDNIRKPKVFTDGTVRYGLLTEISEPTSLHDALKSDAWTKAMDIEFDALMRNRTWHLVPATTAQNIIDCKWVYKEKR